MPDLFISYSRRDGDFVRRLHGALTARGRDVWVDWEDIPPSAEWRDELHSGLEESNALAFVISPDSVRSRECAVELERALEGGKRIVPVLRREPDGGAQVPEPLASRNWVFFREGEDDFEASVAALEAAIDTDREWVRRHTRLLARAGEWERRGRDPSLLLRGGDLAGAERDLSTWREGVEPAPTGLQREYVAAGRRASGRRTRALLAGTAGALAVAIVLGVLALLARDEAVDREREASSRGLAVAGLQLVDRDPELATLLAVEAAERERTPEAEEALRRAVSSLQGRGTWRAAPTGVNTADISPDGERLLAAGRDGTVRLRDFASGRVRELARHRGGAAAGFDRSGRLVVSSGHDGTVRIHDLRGGDQVVRRPARGEVVAAFSADERRVVALDDRAAIHSWRPDGRRAGPTVPGAGAWTGYELSGDGSRILVMYADGRVRAWDTATGHPLGRQRSDADGTGSSAIARGGELAVTSRPDGRVAVWDVETGDVRRLLRGHRGAVSALDISPDGRRIATGGSDNRARLWDSRSGRELHELRAHGDTVHDVKFSGDGRRLISVSLDGTARVWFVRTGEQDTVLRAQRGGIDEARMTPDGRYVVTRSPGGVVGRWEASPGRTRLALRHRGAIEAATLHPSGAYVASSGPDRVQIANVSIGVVSGDDASSLTPGRTADLEFDPAGRRLALADGDRAFVNDLAGEVRWFDHAATVNGVDWSRDGRLLTAAADGTARILARGDAARQAQEPLVHPAAVSEAVFTPDGRGAVTVAADDTVRVWRLRDRSVRDRLKVPQTPGDVAVSPDGRVVAVATAHGDVLLWRPRSRARPVRVTHRYGVNAVRFSRDGRRLASASDDGTARVWSVPDGRQVAEFSGHLDPVNDVDLTADGRFLISASGDRTAKLWDVERGRLVGVFGGHDDRVLQARFAPRGTTVLTVPESGAAGLYTCDACLPLDQLVRRARQLVGRGLTEAERRRFVP